MLTLISRGAGVIVFVGLACVGADTLCKKIMTWKHSHEQSKANTNN